ncbi:MAG: hypothetical protein O9340_04320 [Cyclobacteriaceae bacterium]|nr:hypothetical protein [Cyclobacteriaceae bacterium]
MKVWTPEMLKKLSAMHLYKSYQQIATELGLTKGAVKSKAQKLGLCKRKFWTTQEVIYLIDNYPHVNNRIFQ